MTMDSLPPGYRALVVGAGGAIGSALVGTLRADPRCGGVLTAARGTLPDGTAPDVAFDLTDEAAITAAAAALRAHAPLHLVIVATGVLHVDGRAPEKRLAELDAATLARALAVNAIGPALLLKHLHELLPVHERGLLAVLSARVGSIGDNRLGGWYGYRAAKAALNMLLRTAAIEVARRRPLAVLAALHPGTVRTPLSAPVIGAQPARETVDADTAARNLLVVLDALPADGPDGERGHFRAWDGQPIPW